MDFREWMDDGYDSHDVRVSHGSEEVALHPSEAQESLDLSYYKDDGYETTFRVMPMASQRKGLGFVGSRADFIAILLFSKVHPGKGADIAFLKSLNAALSARGIKSVPYKNVGLGMFGGLLASAAKKMDAAEKAELEAQIRASHDKDFRDGSKIPDFGSGSSNSVNVTPNISVGSNSWSFFFAIPRGAKAREYVGDVIEMMKDSLKPLMDSGLVHEYRVTRKGVEVESGKSSAGEDEDAKTEREVRQYSGYIKFLARTMLEGDARQMVLKRMGSVLMNWNWKPADIGEYSQRTDMDDLLRFANQTDSQLLVLFVEAVKDNDKAKMMVIDALAAYGPENHNVDGLVYSYEDLVDGGWDRYLDNPTLYPGNVLEFVENEEFFEKVARNEYHAFISEYKDRLVKELRSKGTSKMSRHVIEDLAKLLKALGIQ